MSVVYNVTANVTRSTAFGRDVFRGPIGLTSGTATKEFGQTIDLTKNPLPLFPILVVSSNITSVQFLMIQVTGGGIAKIRLTKDAPIYNTLDLDISGTLIMSGVNIQQITVLGVDTNCLIECVGMGI